jgi:hypothetical protein
LLFLPIGVAFKDMKLVVDAEGIKEVDVDDIRFIEENLVGMDFTYSLHITATTINI